MQIDPTFEFRRLAEEYHARTNDELAELAEDFADLTEPAQQALRQEMQSRRLGDPSRVSASLNHDHPEPQAANAPIRGEELAPDLPSTVLARTPEIVADVNDNDADGASPHDYTWKTVLCDCETTEQAQELAEALRQAGLDSWIQPPREFGRRYARVLVAADQLDQARTIAAEPISQEIVDDSKEEVPEFVAPVCPKCGASDPVLKGVDPQNTWRCEQCNAEWTDPAEVEDTKDVKSRDLPS